MHPLITKMAVPLSGNSLVQSVIQKIVFSQFLHYLIGIGAGSSAIASGEKVVFELLKQHLVGTKQLCIFDVGANHGLFVDMIRQNLATFPLKIYAFEPSSHSYKILCEAVGKDENIVLNNLALGKHSGESTLYYDTEGTWLASLSQRRLDHFEIRFKHSETIKIDTLDDYCLKENIRQIDLLKLDVEGHEMDVLQGAVKMLEKK